MPVRAVRQVRFVPNSEVVPLFNTSSIDRA